MQASALVSVPLIVWLSGRMGKQGAYAVGLIWWALVMLGLAFLPPSARTVAYILAGLAGVGIAAAHVIPWSMVPDVIEVDELETGQRRAKLQGRSVLTIEGVAGADGGLDPVQDAFLAEGAVQCGYCTPGMVLSAKALLARNPKPDVPAIEEALSGNFCRCTGYGKIVNVAHGVSLASRYGHLSEILVRPGQQVKRGDVIGRVGSTGRASGPHLHYEVLRGGRAVDPRKYLGESLF